MSGQQVTELAGKMFLVLLILYVLSNPVGALFWVFCIILLFAGVFGLLYLFCIVASWIERLRARYLASHPEVAVRKKKAVIQRSGWFCGVWERCAGKSPVVKKPEPGL